MAGTTRSLVWRFSRQIKFCADLSAWALAIVLGFGLRLESSPLLWWRSAAALGLVATPVLLYATHQFGLARQSWAHIGTKDLRSLAMSAGLVTLVLFLLASVVPTLIPVAISRSVPLIAGMLAIIILAGLRAGYRLFHETRPTEGHASEKRHAFVVGTDAPALALAWELQTKGQYNVVGHLDPLPSRQGISYQGIPVVGTLEGWGAAARQKGVDIVFMASPAITPQQRQRLESQAHAMDLEYRALPGLDDLLMESPRQIQSVMKSLTRNGRAKNVLVIGGGGYIGSALVPRLLTAGFHVRVLDSFIYGKEPLEPILDHGHLEIVEGDFRNVDRIVEAMQGIDTVIHLGAIVGDPACALDEDLTVETNLMATKMVAEIAKGFGITRFVFASTCSVYGASDGILDETSDLNPVSLYARTKIASERVLARMAGDGFRPIILRFGTVYGFSGRTRFDLVVNVLTAKAVLDGVITLYGGDQWRPFVHVDDIAKAVLMSVTTPVEKLNHTVYNVGTDEQNFTLRQVAETIHARVPSSEIKDFGLDQDRRNYRVSFARLKQDMGYHADWTMERGIDQVITAFKLGKVTSMTDARYSNVKFLTEGGMSTVVSRVFGSVYELLDETSKEPKEEKQVPA